MTTTVGRGLLAGAVGTALLNLASYLDMALTGRPPSDAPDETVARTARAVGLAPSGDPNRRTAYGAVAGIGAGLGVGVLASSVRRLGVRLPAPVGAAATGAAAMAAADLPMALTGVSDPRTWSASDWTRDLLPHLAYGIGVRWALDRSEPPAAERKPDRAEVSAGLLTRSFALGAATGGRSSFGIAGPALVAGGTSRAVLGVTLAAAELTADKLPNTPSRAEPGPSAVRGVIGGGSGWFLARRRGANPVLPALAGAAGAAAGTVAGAVWRELAGRRGWTWQAALAEDGAAAGLAWLACRNLD